MTTPDPDPGAHAGFGAELRIDWIAGTEVGAATGSLGLTILPGKHGLSSRYPGRTYRRDLEEDLAALRDANVRTLLLLVEDAELERWSSADLPQRAARHGIAVLRHPMPDGTAPRSMEEMEEIADEILAGLSGGNVAVSCMGGVGRSGTIVACSLVRAGMAPDVAIARVREVRHPTAVETAEQEAFVRAYAAHRGRRLQR